MTHAAKSLRLRRILRKGRIVMVPMDHGASMGPLPGLEDARATTDLVRQGGATCVVAHKGIARHVAPALGDMGLLVHLSASTDLNPDRNDKRLVGDVADVLRLGADAASVHVNVGSATESQQVADLGRIAGECEAWGVPLLAMMYPRGHDIRDPHDPNVVAHVARLGAEIGADVVKVPYTGSTETFRRVVAGCPVPVVLSGGARAGSDRDFLATVRAALDAGGAGVSVGRNVWQHPDPVAMTRAVSEMVLNDAPLDKALSALKG